MEKEDDAGIQAEARALFEGHGRDALTLASAAFVRAYQEGDPDGRDRPRRLMLAVSALTGHVPRLVDK